MREYFISGVNIYFSIACVVLNLLKTTVESIAFIIFVYDGIKLSNCPMQKRTV